MAKGVRRKAPPSTERKIYFYRANAGLTAAGMPRAVPFDKMLQEVADKPCATDGRYWEQLDGNVVCAWPDDGYAHDAVRLATVRRVGLPLLEDGGSLSGLNLPATAGLYEAVHAMFFPNNIVGIEFNFYGPRPTRFPRYFQVVASDQSPTFTLDPLLRQDVTQQLGRLRQLRVFDLKVRASYADTAARADQTLGRALRACRDVGESQVVHHVLQPEPHGRQPLASRMLTATRRLARRSDLRENALTFQVRGVDDDSRIDTIDVLRDELVSSKRVVLMDRRSRAVDDRSAYGAILEAYTELRPQLELAAAAALS